MIDICNDNIKIITEAYKNKDPIKLKSYPNFKDYEDVWWEEFNEYAHVRKKDISYNNIGYTKFPIKKHGAYKSGNKEISIVEYFSEHLFSKIFKQHKVTCWISLSDADLGTDWHKDLEIGSSIPSYLICINLIGSTDWKFKDYDPISLTPGDLICQNGSAEHSVQPTSKRITIAGHSSINDIIL